MREVLEELLIEQPVLERAPLKAVICQLRFQEVLGLSDEEVRPIQKALGSLYPVLEREEGVQVGLGPEGLKPTGNVRRTFRFKDSGDIWSVMLTPDSLALESSAYTNFKDFATRWCDIVETTVNELDITIQERIGLRYVNELEVEGEPTADRLRALVREELVSIVGASERTSVLLQSQQEARFDQDDGVITLRHGLVPTDRDKRSYFLDFDYYDEERREFDPNEQIKKLVNFNHRLFELFRWALTPETFDSFGPTEREEAHA